MGREGEAEKKIESTCTMGRKEQDERRAEEELG